MAAVRIEVTFDTSDLVRKLENMGQKFESFPMGVFGETIATAIDEVIQTEGGGTWPYLKGRDVEYKFKKRAGKTHMVRTHKMLQDTGLLANLQTDVGTDWVEVSSPAPYAGFHVSGTKHMPKRNFLDIDMDGVMEQVAEDLLAEVAE